MPTQPRTFWWKLQTRLQHSLRSNYLKSFFLTVILVNTFILGLEAIPTVRARFLPVLITIDHICAFLFVSEISLKIFVFRKTYFKSLWNIFDTFIVIVSIFPGYHIFNILRSFRVIRVLRIIEFVPQLKLIVETLLKSITSILGVLIILFILFYIFAVIGTHLFGKDFPQLFGSLAPSYNTLFQIMTLEGWASDIAWPIWEKYPYSWIYFIIFIFLSTLIFLNLILGILVSAMQDQRINARFEKEKKLGEQDHMLLTAELKALQYGIRGLKKKLYLLENSALSEQDPDKTRS